MVVISGLTLIAAPLWETLVSAALAKTFDLSAYIPNEPLYGAGLVGLGLLYHLGASFLDAKLIRETNRKDSAAHEHDKVLAAKLLEFAPEREVIHHLECLGSDHSANDARWKILSAIEQFGDLAENEFLNQTIQHQLELLTVDCRNLTRFIAANFFPIKGGIGSGRTCLHPDLNVDRGGTWSAENSVAYTSHARQLIDLVNSATDNYRKLRRAIKSELAM